MGSSREVRALLIYPALIDLIGGAVYRSFIHVTSHQLATLKRRLSILFQKCASSKPTLHCNKLDVGHY